MLPRALARRAAALATVLAVPGLVAGSARADAPWSAPAAVSGSDDVASGAVRVLFTSGHGGVVVYNAPGEGFASPLIGVRLDGSGAPEHARTIAPRADGLDATLGSFAAGADVVYAGEHPVGDLGGRALVASAPRAGASFSAELRGPLSSGGVLTAAAAHPDGGDAAAYATIGGGGRGSVYLVRKPRGSFEFGRSLRLSAKGRIHSVAVAVNGRGDILTAWERSGRVEARFRYGSGHLGRVLVLGRASDASKLSVALRDDRGALVAWVDQRVDEGMAGTKAHIAAAARPAGRDFLPATVLERYPDGALVPGAGVKAQLLADGAGVVAWSGRTSVRAAIEHGEFGAPQDLAALPGDAYDLGGGLADLVALPNGGAVAAWLQPAADGSSRQVEAAELSQGRFGPAETVSAPGVLATGAAAAFDPATGHPVIAWVQTTQPGETGPVEIASRNGS